MATKLVWVQLEKWQFLSTKYYLCDCKTICQDYIFFVLTNAPPNGILFNTNAVYGNCGRCSVAVDICVFVFV